MKCIIQQTAQKTKPRRERDDDGRLDQFVVLLDGATDIVHLLRVAARRPHPPPVPVVEQGEEEGEVGCRKRREPPQGPIPTRGQEGQKVDNHALRQTPHDQALCLCGLVGACSSHDRVGRGGRGGRQEGSGKVHVSKGKSHY